MSASMRPSQLPSTRDAIDLLHLAVLDHKSVPLAPVVSKDLGSIEAQVQCVSELPCRIGYEADL